MSATIIQFPAAPARGVRFTREARSALIALCASRPRWEVAFIVGECGDEYASLENIMCDGGAAFFVSAQRSGGVLVTKGLHLETVGEFTTGAAAVEALRAAGV